MKNDHLGFEVLYVYRGVVRKYRPDFLMRLAGGDTLVLETKGQDTEQAQVKRRYLEEWTQAVNAHGGFGRWRWAVAGNPGEIRDIPDYPNKLKLLDTPEVMDLLEKEKVLFVDVLLRDEQVRRRG